MFECGHPQNRLSVIPANVGIHNIHSLNFYAAILLAIEGKFLVIEGGRVARRTSGLNTIVKVVKAVNRVQKQAARERQRHEREYARAERLRFRQAEQAQRERDRANAQVQRDKVKANAQAIKDEIQFAKECYDDRVEERRLVKEDIINEFMR